MLTLVAVAVLLQAEMPPTGGASPPPVPPPAQPTSVLSILRPGAISEELAVKLEDEVRRALGNAGVNVQPDVETKRMLAGRGAAACTANLACYALLATVARTPVSVIIEASAVQTDLAVVLHAVSANDSTLVAETSFVVPAAALAQRLGNHVQPFAIKVAEAAIAAAPLPNAFADAPVKPLLVPEEKPVVVAAAPAPEPPSRTPAILMGVGTLAAAAVAIAFTANAVSAQSCLNGPVVGGRPTVCVAQDRAVQLEAQANRNIAIGAGAGAVGVGLAAATAWLWTHP